MGEKIRGSLLLIGGAEDKRRDKEILKRFITLLKERGSSLVILTSATSEPDAVGQDYQLIFEELGIDDIKILNIDSRKEAASPENAGFLEKAAGIFFTGGDQLRITSLFGGSAVYKAIQKAYENGAIIAGTSAGASAVSDIMIVGGHGNDSPSMDSVQLASGLGLLEEVVVDQHFAQRGRMNRLLMAIAYNPYILGIGIDEDTAIEITPDATFVVRGNRTVMVLDGRDISHSNISEMNEKEPLALMGVRVHILPANYKYNLKDREIIIPESY
ncbi:MAG: cyanophycinase [Halanaerobiales bacterium]